MILFFDKQNETNLHNIHIIAVSNLNNNPPPGDLRGGYLGYPRVAPDIGGREQILLPLPVLIPPLEKVPVFQSEAQLLTAAQIEFMEYMLQMTLHSFRRDDQCFCDFIIPIP